MARSLWVIGVVGAIAASAGSATAKVARTPALLVGQPQVSTLTKGAADLIYASLIAGLHDSLVRPIDPARREFAAVFTERAITDEQKTKIAPVVLFAKYTSSDLDRALEGRFEQAQHLRLARFLEITIAELSPANYEVTLVMYDPATWTPLAEKRIGGCNETIDDLTAQARELASTLIEPSTRSQPRPKIEIQPPSADGAYLVGTRITLDSCGIANRSGDQFTVTWRSQLLQNEVRRRRVSLVLEKPGTVEVSQSTGGAFVPYQLRAITPPRADPTIQKCAKATEGCREATHVPLRLATNAQLPVPTARASAIAALSAFVVDPASDEVRSSDERGTDVEDRQRSSGDLRLIRLEPGPNHIYLAARGVEVGQTVQWTQLSGPEITATNLKTPSLSFDLDGAKSGYYVFKLAVSAGTLQTAEAKVSFLAAPGIHADAGRREYRARVGQPMLLDASASYDVLGDQMSFTWVLSNPEQQDLARIVDNHADQARFIANQAGRYPVRLFARVARKIDDATLTEIAVADAMVVVSNRNVEAFIDTFGSASTWQTYRAGLSYAPSISHFSTIARTFSYRWLIGGAFGRAYGGDWGSAWTAEGFLGLGVRLRDTVVIDAYGRFYSVQDEFGHHVPGFGVGGTMSFTTKWNFMLQLKGRIGPPTLDSADAPETFAVEAGAGVAVEL